MVIVTERTPNPEAMKFVPHVRLTDGATWSFEREGFVPATAPLAAALFALAGVGRVFIAPDFVTVTREAAGPGWTDLRYAIIAALAEHLASGAPVVCAPAEGSASADRLEKEIRDVLARHVRPGVARDGGDILFRRFDADTGVLWIRMQGACGGCPSARLTLKAGVEQIVRRFVPEVQCVEEAAAPEASLESITARLKRLAKGVGQRAGGRGTLFTHGGKLISRWGSAPEEPGGQASAVTSARVARSND